MKPPSNSPAAESGQGNHGEGGGGTAVYLAPSEHALLPPAHPIERDKGGFC